MKSSVRVAWIAGLVTAVLAISASGCRKEKDSLVIVELNAAETDQSAKNLTTLTITVGDTSQDFDLPATGIPAMPATISYGVYVSSSVTGSQKVTATAKPATGCDGEAASGNVDIASAGSSPTIMLLMMPSKTICAMGGNGGTGVGSGGRGGGAGGPGGRAGGAGGSGTGGTGIGGTGAGGTTSGGGPTLVGCAEINHQDTAACGPSCSATDDTAVFGVAFSPTNPKLFVTGGNDGRVKVWQVANRTATAQGTELTGTGLGLVAFSPDGKSLAVGRTGGIGIYDVATWSLTRTLTVTNDVFGVAFSPDGSQVISIDNDQGLNTNLYVHAVGTVQALQTVPITDGYVLGVSPVSSGGSLPLAVGTSDGTALIYNLTSTGFSGPTTVTESSGGYYVEVAQFSPLGTLFASGGDDGFLQFWSTPVTATEATIAPEIDVFANTVASAEVFTAAFSPDSRYVAVGGGGYADSTGAGSLTLWTQAPPRNAVSTEYDTPNSYDVVSVAFAPDSSMIVAGEGDCGCVIVCPQ